MGDEKEGEKLKKMDNFCFCSDKWGDKWGDKTQKKNVVRMGYNAKIRGKTVYFLRLKYPIIPHLKTK